MKLKILSALAIVLATAAFTPEEEVVFDDNGNKLPDSSVNSPLANWKILKLAESRALNGVGLVDIFGGGGCTGAFLDTGAGPDGPAYVLSNGHCAGPNLMKPTDVLVDKAVTPGMNFRFNYFIDAGPAVRKVAIKRIAYATMHNTDVTVFELDATFGQVIKAGFIPHRIAAQDPARGTRVEMVGVPQSGVRRAERFVRRSTCEIGGRANLREGGYDFTGAFRHQCSSVGGSSGSPVISLETHEIVAINNTGVDDKALDEPECAIDRPCEVASDGRVRTDVNTNYAQRVSDIPSCFDGKGVFNIRQDGCRLEK
ncbi:MAG: trypsin-like peptidase domain-containing protein [Deltaproteobacteria bacterium]|nr:trypsin-like peptidase domain-containing protein [Deltaproteobacteria bacterium]